MPMEIPTLESGCLAKKHGKGTYHSKNGHCWFVGDWESGEFTQGEWRFNGGSYNGAFKYGKPAEGPGTFYFQNGNEQSGTWIPLPKGEEEAGEEEEEGAPPKLQWIVS
mmetsp:Transcript_5982/g.13619  ORF Transcript_5982/g.13619 Transcript_5982/m.13619 type:complete len:108 (+) Transcript_5982:325-648(+)